MGRGVTITSSRAYPLALLSAPSMSEKAGTAHSSVSIFLAHCLSWAAGVIYGDAGLSPCLVGSAAPGGTGSAAGASNDAAVDRGETVCPMSVAPVTVLMSEQLRGDELKLPARSSWGAFSDVSLHCNHRALATGLQGQMNTRWRVVHVSHETMRCMHLLWPVRYGILLNVKRKAEHTLSEAHASTVSPDS